MNFADWKKKQREQEPGTVKSPVPEAANNGSQVANMPSFSQWRKQSVLRDPKTAGAIGEAVSSWVEKYNSTMKGIQDYSTQLNGGYTADVSGGYGGAVDELLRKYTYFQKYAADFGLTDGDVYYKRLLDLQGNIKSANDWYAKFTPTKEQAAAGYTAEDLFDIWKKGDKNADGTYTDAEIMQLVGLSLRDETAVQQELAQVNKELEGYSAGSTVLYDALEHQGNMDNGVPVMDLGPNKYGYQSDEPAPTKETKEYRALEEKKRKLEEELAFIQAYPTMVLETIPLEELAAKVEQAKADADAKQRAAIESEAAYGQMLNPGNGAANSFNWGQAEEDAYNAELESLLLEGQNARNDYEESLAHYEKLSDLYTYRSHMKRIDSMTELERLAFEGYMVRLDEEGTREWESKLTDNQRKIIISPLHYLEQQGYTTEELNKLSETYGRYLNEQKMQKVIEDAKKFAKDFLILPTAAAFPANLLGAITGTVSAVDSYVKDLFGLTSYHTLDPNASGYKLQVFADTVRAAEGEDLGAVGKIVYNAFNSSVDSLLRVTVAGGTGALVLAGMGSFSSTVREVSQNGGSPEQAIMLGLANAGLEALTEKVSIESFFKLSKPSDAIELIKNLNLQGAIEVSEEELSFLGSIAAEAVILGKSSNVNRRITELVSQGKSNAEAKKIAYKELFMEAAETAITSYLSGSMMGGANAIAQNIYDTKQEKAAQELDRLVKKIAATMSNGQGGVDASADLGVTVGGGEQITNNVADTSPGTKNNGVKGTDSSTPLGMTGTNPAAAPQQVNTAQTAVPQNDTYEAIKQDWEDNERAYMQGAITQEEHASVKAQIDERLETWRQAENLRKNNAPVVSSQEQVEDVGQMRAYAEQMLAQGEITEEEFDGMMELVEHYEEENYGGVREQAAQDLPATVQADTYDGGINHVDNGTQYTGQTTAYQGNGVPDGSSQRNDGAGTGKQAGGMASLTEGGRSSWADHARATVQRENAGKNLRKVSSQELGVTRGTETANVKVLPQEMWDDAMRRTAERVQQETGLPVTYVLGKIEVRGKNGVSKVRGVISSNGIIIQANNKYSTIDQIADHEIYHQKAGAVAGLNWNLRNYIMTRFSQEEFSAVLDKYIEAYRGIIDVPMNADSESYEAAMRELEEEIFADAYAGINNFGAGVFAEDVNQWMDDHGVGKQSRMENGTKETTGPPLGEKYSADNDVEQIVEESDVVQAYAGAVDKDVLAFVEDVQNGRAWPSKKVSLGQVSERMAADIEKITGVANKAGDEITLNTSGVEHIFIRHGKNGKADRSMQNNQDIARIKYILQNYDNASLGKKLSYEHKNRDNTPSKTVVFSKKINDTYFVVEAVPDTGRTAVVSAYINKNGAAQVPDANTPGWNVQNELASTPTKRVTQDNTDVKKEKFSVDPEGAAEDTVPEDSAPKQEGKSVAGTQVKVAQKALVKSLANEFGIPEERAQELVSQYTTEAKRKTLQRPKTPKVDKPVVESKAIIAKSDLRKSVISLFSIPEGQKAELGAVIDSYADRLIKNGELTEADRKAFFDRMYASGVMTVPADEYLSLARSYIAKGRIYVNPRIQAEFGDDWAGFRRRAFGAGVYLTSDKTATGVDQWNKDLSDVLPGLFDAEETDGRLALERIVDIAEEGRDDNVSLAEYTAKLAQQEHVSESEYLDQMERQLDWALRTFAEKAKLELKLRDRTGIQVAKERARHKEMADRQREQKELRELQKKTLKQLQWLSRNRNRAPEELQSTWDEVLGDLDVMAVGAANEMNWSDKYNATWRDLAQMYIDAKEHNPSFLANKELENIVNRLNNKKIADMDIDALQNLYKAAIGLRTELYNRNNLINDEMRRLFAEVYTDSKHEITSAAEGFKGSKVDKFFNLDQLTPMNAMQRMGGWDPNGAFYSMAKQLENGERDMRAYYVKANRMLQDFLEEHEDWVRKADGQGKDAIWYEIEVPELLQLGMGDKPIFGDTVKVYMTPSQKVHMYLESKNQDNLRHMTGGRTFADKELYSKGKRQEAFAQGKTIRLAPETVKQLVSDLTAEEMELARILEMYYNTFAKQEINRVSNVLYGYDKAMGSFYAPIYTNSNYVQSELGVFDTTAEGVGNLKGRQHAMNPTYNIGAFDAFEKHVDQTSRFVGMAIPARNWQTFLNWREKNNSTGDVITHQWGQEGKKYIEDLITTLQGGKTEKKTSASKLPDWLHRNYISAVFGLNPSIVLKQLGSIPLASVYLGGSNIPSLGQIANIDTELIGKYSQDLAWRTMGYATPETKQLKDNPNWTQRNKFLSFTFGGGAITAMDGWAASVLWPWAENKVRNANPDLEVGTQAQIDAGESPFYKEVAKEFEYALSRSQSVADEMHQSSMRKDKGYARAFTMFKSDSAQIYNTIRQKIGEAQYYARTGADTETIRASKKAVGAVVLAAITGFVWAEGIDLLMNLWKHKGKKYRDEEEELTIASILQQVGENTIGNIAGVIVGGEELAEFIGNIITGDRWYGIDTPGLGQLTDMMSAIEDAAKGMKDVIGGAIQLANDGGDVGEYFRQHSADILGCIKEISKTAAMYLYGMPADNLEAYLLGLVKWVSPELGTAYEDLFTTANKGGLKGLTGGALAERVGNIMDNRGVSTESTTDKALAGLYEAGYTAAVPSGIPGKVSVDGDERELSEYQKQTYGLVWNDLVSGSLDALVNSQAFKNADQKLQEKMLSALYKYAAEHAKAELFDDYEVSAAASVNAKGEDLAKYAAWRSRTDELKQAEKMADLAEQDMPDKLKTEIVGSLIGTEMETETGNPSGWAKFQEALKAGMSVDEYLELRAEEGDIDKYLEFTGAGVGSDDALELTQEIAVLEPEEGKQKVSSTQRWRAAVNSVDTAVDQLEALSVLMTDSQYEKVRIAYDNDIEPNIYVKLYETLPKYDANGNGSYTNAEVADAIDAMCGNPYQQMQAAISGDGSAYNLTNVQKAVLWQLVTGAKSAKNNPYSVAAGQKVVNARASADDDNSSSGGSLSFSEEIARQWAGG